MSSSLSPLKRPQNHTSNPPSRTTLTHAMEIPAIAPALSLLPWELLADGKGGDEVLEGDGEERGVSASDGKSSPGESW